MTAAMKAPILVSRSSLQRLAIKYPNYLKPIIKPIKKEPETPWGPKFKLFAYSCAAIAVPYSMGVVISASSSLRDYLEGDSDPSNNTLGRRLVSFVRWYWGEDDAIPYSEYLENQISPISDTEDNNSTFHKEENEISLPGESSASDRQTELEIQKRIHDSYNIHVFHEESEKDLIVPGTILYQQQINEVQNQKEPEHSNDRIWINFHDQPNTADHDTSNRQEWTAPEISPVPLSSVSDSIVALTNVFSAWHYFDSNSNNTTPSNANGTKNQNSMSKSSLDEEFESHIQSIRDKIQKLKSELNNPGTLRAYDDISDEIASMKQEEKQLRRERRTQKFKALFSIQS